MISEDIKLEHESFVSGHNGSSSIDVILAILPIIPGSALAASLTQEHGVIACFVIEFLLCALPLILSFTYMNEITLELNAVMILLFLIRIVHVIRAKVNVSSYLPRRKNRLVFLTTCRATVNLATIIAILAVDFHIFPRRFAKTEKYGYSLMDVGAACYVFMNAITDNKYKSMSRHSVFDFFFLVCLGVIRLISVIITHYQHHVTEYGLHANFFFTLAVIKITCFWVPLIPLQAKVLLGAILSIIHQTNLSSGLGLWTLSDEPRDNFIAANREWFVSMPGYIVIYLFGSSIGEYIFLRKPSVHKLGIISLILFSILYILEDFIQLHPSRRLGNLPFILWITGFFIFLMTFFKIVENLWQKTPTTCLIFDAINDFPLLFFLLGNVSTGVINMLFNTLEKSNLFAFLIINLYVFSLLTIVTTLYLKIGPKKINKIIK